MIQEIIGNAILYCADCRDVDREVSDYIISDPPYVHKYGASGGGFASAKIYQKGNKLSEMNDFVLSDFENVFKKTKNGFVCTTSRDGVFGWIDFAKKSFGLFDLHFWHKTDAIPFTNNCWKSDIEYIVLGHKKVRHEKMAQVEKSKLYQSTTNKETYHPTTKPLGLMEKYVLVLSKKGETILDPFMGSGTTGVAAVQNSRKFIGIENDKKYFSIACRRLENALKITRMF
jgi:site-specific DNA-methyltransferase (adenine-specific)